MQAEVTFENDKIVLKTPLGVAKFSVYYTEVNGVSVEEKYLEKALNCPELTEFAKRVSSIKLDRDIQKKLINTFVEDKDKAEKTLEDLIKNAPTDEPKIYKNGDYYIVIATKNEAFGVFGTHFNAKTLNCPQWVYGSYKNYYGLDIDEISDVKNVFEYLKNISKIKGRAHYNTKKKISQLWFSGAKDSAKKLIEKYNKKYEENDKISEVINRLEEHEAYPLKNAYAIRCYYSWFSNKIIFKDNVYEVGLKTLGRIIRRGSFEPEIYKSAKLINDYAELCSCSSCIKAMGSVKELVPLAVKLKIAESN